MRPQVTLKRKDNADDYLQKTIRQAELVHGDDARRHGQEDGRGAAGAHRLPPDEAVHLRGEARRGHGEGASRTDRRRPRQARPRRARTQRRPAGAKRAHVVAGDVHGLVQGARGRQVHPSDIPRKARTPRDGPEDRGRHRQDRQGQLQLGLREDRQLRPLARLQGQFHDHQAHPQRARFWRNLKNECLYIHSFDSIKELRCSLDEYIEFYNFQRIHQALDYKTPNEVYSKVA